MPQQFTTHVTRAVPTVSSTARAINVTQQSKAQTPHGASMRQPLELGFGMVKKKRLR